MTGDPRMAEAVVGRRILAEIEEASLDEVRYYLILFSSP